MYTLGLRRFAIGGYLFLRMEAGENVLITWFSIADKQDNLYQVNAAPALTNQRAAFICVLQSE